MLFLVADEPSLRAWVSPLGFENYAGWVSGTLREDGSTLPDSSQSQRHLTSQQCADLPWSTLHEVDVVCSSRNDIDTRTQHVGQH